jgi:hypothetical protein
MDLPDYTMTGYSLKPNVAKNLSHSTKTIPMMEEITPRWLLTFLPWVGVEAGVYSVIKTRKITEENVEPNGEYCGKHVKLYSGNLGENEMPNTYPDYEECPKDYVLSLVQTILKVNTHVTDIFNNPINQLQEQTRLTIEAMKERQEWEIINNKDFGLVNSVDTSMKVKSRKGTPTPDDLDELLSKVWKKPAFFLAHPKAIAAFGRECTRRGVPPATINLYGSPFISWRGVPIIPSDKLMVNGGSTNILLMRVGEKEQGVIGLHQPGIPDEASVPSLSVKLGGIDNRGVASYILSLYFSAAVLADDALGMLENVEVGRFHEYE